MDFVHRKLKSGFTLFLCGLSAISLFPNTNYGQNTLKTSAAIADASWNMTGKAMRQALNSAGERYHGR